MDPTVKICQRCAQVIPTGKICLNCTAVDQTLAGQLVAPGVNQDRLPVKACLVEQKSGKAIPITGTKCKIGRDTTNQIVLGGDQFASRFHAWISYENGHFYIEDLGSINGTLLDGNPLMTRQLLTNGSQIRFGRTDFVFQT